jgi:competence protein ComEC
MRERICRRSPRSEVHPHLAEVRRDFSRRLAVGVEDRRLSVGLERAILLGEKSGIPHDVKQMFVQAGTIHIFAISGLHVMVVASVIMLILSVLQVPPRWCGALSLPLLWGYVAMIGAPPSAVRAAAMATLGCIAPVFRRRPDPLTAWSLTFFAVHVLSPRLIGDVGCRLSFAVMLGIVLVTEFFGGRRDGRCSGLCVPLAAWAAGAPIAAAVFGRITPGGILANMLLLPAAGATVWAGAGGIIASFVSENLAAHLNNLSALFIDAMVAVSAAVSSLPGANVEIESVSAVTAFAWYAAVLLPFLLRRWARSRKCF